MIIKIKDIKSAMMFQFSEKVHYIYIKNHNYYPALILLTFAKINLHNHLSYI